jgi:MmgE/PrpD N-terminal domain
LGYGVTTSPELAAYANTSMVRHTDFNDHASDMMPGVLAIGEALHASGTQVMIGIILAYQINQALTDAAGDYQRRGWDQGLGVGAATALACGKLLGFDEDQLANALEGDSRFWIAGLGDQLAHRVGQGEFRGVDDLPGPLGRVTTDHPPAPRLQRRQTRGGAQTLRASLPDGRRWVSSGAKTCGP